jgi:hypothetical protein
MTGLKRRDRVSALWEPLNSGGSPIRSFSGQQLVFCKIEELELLPGRCRCFSP